MRELRKLFIVFFAVTAGIALLNGARPASAQSTAKASPVKASHAKTTASDQTQHDPVETFGSKTAPVTMEVFSDFQCPSCRALYEDALKDLMKDYVASGKVYLVHHDFPLPMHKYSRIAARYGRAAAHIGKYEQVEAALYDNQAAWSLDGNLEKYVSAAVGPTDMKRIDHLMEGCKDLPAAPGVAPAKLNIGQTGHTCPLDPSIDKDVALGQQVGVNSTPTFVISGHGQKSQTAGSVPYQTLKQYFDYLLSLK
jgi:protein-disulfide isomerase